MEFEIIKLPEFISAYFSFLEPNLFHVICKDTNIVFLAAKKTTYVI